MSSSPSVQLYSVRDAMERDLSGTIARLAGIGFTVVEPYAFAERTAELAAALTAAGVSAPSGHAAVIDAADPARIFDAAEQLRVWRAMDAADEEPVVIYHSHTATEAYPSRTDISYASQPDAHYVLVSTRDPDTH